jgi:hypothetical protein
MFIRDCGVEDEHPEHDYLKLWRKSDFSPQELPGSILFRLPSEWVVEYRCVGRDVGDNEGA